MCQQISPLTPQQETKLNAASEPRLNPPADTVTLPA